MSQTKEYMHYQCPDCDWETRYGCASKLIEHLMKVHGYPEEDAEKEVEKQQ